jgi:hypothetical protein
MNLRILLVLHAIVTFAAGVVLVVAPDAIPSVVDVHMAPGSFVICYFLAGAEFALAFLSFYAARRHDAESMHIAVRTIIVFHTSTALLEIYALAHGSDVKLWGNVAVRIIVTALFLYYGELKQSRKIA